MTSPNRDRGSRPARLRALGGAGALLALVVVAGGVAGSASAERAIVFGKSPDNPAPSCSEASSDECQITGQVTGYQRSINGGRNPFRARENGKIVAWSVDLAKPSQEEQDIFGAAAQTDEFGKSPTAGISILRKKGKQMFRLQRASPILRVQSHYGRQPIFTLAQPLRIKKGNIVALTTATWLPAFAFKRQRANDVWIASRGTRNCEVPDSVPADQRLEYFFAHTRPHRNVGSERKYACSYDRARLLYKAYFVPKN